MFYVEFTAFNAEKNRNFKLQKDSQWYDLCCKLTNIGTDLCSKVLVLKFYNSP